MPIAKNLFDQEIERIISTAIKEDIGSGDYSSLACIPKEAKGKAELLVKEDGVLAGVDFAKKLYHFVDQTLKVEVLKPDGTKVKKGDSAFYISGSKQSILKAERISLNAMQRMSAIASKTNAFAEALKGTKTKILDTRKTTPGIRLLEKWAVQIGGGVNHRFGLYDMIMLKDNHIDFAGGVSQAIQQTKSYLKQNNLDLKIVVEARDLNEIEEILKNDGAHRILIDNFNFEDTRKAVKLINGAVETESSGNITLDTVRQYADCGVDFVSSGALTHSIHNLDLSLKAL